MRDIDSSSAEVFGLTVQRRPSSHSRIHDSTEAPARTPSGVSPSSFTSLRRAWNLSHARCLSRSVTVMRRRVPRDDQPASMVPTHRPSEARW